MIMVQVCRNRSSPEATACRRPLDRRRLCIKAATMATLAVAMSTALSPSSVAQSSAESSVALPALPAPHPMRASPGRHSAYRQMLATWRPTPSSQTDPKTDRDLPPVPVQAERQQTATPALLASRTPKDGGEKSPPATVAHQAGTGSPTPPANASEPETPPATWSADEVRDAEATCADVMKSLAAEWDRLPPLRHGECGTPAPLRLRKIGSKSGVAIEPAATTNCAMVARLYQWLETVAQPAAEKHFSSRIVALKSASSYMCRNRYNDPAAKISEHAFANALDIAAFKLADGRTIEVETYWGKSVAARDAAAATAAGVTPPLSKTALPSRAITIGLDRADARNRNANATTRPDATTPEMSFLHALHDGACGIFTTVLGPEANRAHQDHFHFDLKSRRGASFCQ